jgi:hypothetical protein
VGVRNKEQGRIIRTSFMKGERKERRMGMRKGKEGRGVRQAVKGE